MTKSSSTKLCIHHSLEDYFVRKYPESEKNIKPYYESAANMIAAIDEQCDAVVINKDAFDNAVSSQDNLCNGKVLLSDTILMTINNVVYASAVSVRSSADLIDYINKMIDAGFYTKEHKKYRDEWSKDITSISNCFFSDIDEDDKRPLGRRDLTSPIALAISATLVGLSMFIFRKVTRLESKRRLGFDLQGKDADYVLTETIRKMAAYDMIKGKTYAKLLFSPCIWI